MESLRDTLSALLPAGLTLSLFRISHPPIKTQPLYTPAPGQPPQPTTLETHFLAVAHGGILCFAIEVLIFVSVFKQTPAGKPCKETTIFVSKADSSGYLPTTAATFLPKDSPGNKESTLRTISTSFLEHVVREHRSAHPNIRKTTISLFARSQGQYLFPDSLSNPKKHVLTDRGLIKWWCKVLDPLLQSFNQEETSDKASAYLLVPGFDKYETAAFFPPKTRQSKLYPNAKRWVHGHPLREDPARHLTVREVIPLFPDDPKARFLAELEAEKVIPRRNGKQSKSQCNAGSGWVTVQTLDHFWELMSFRQECSSGASTGFIWIVVEKKIAKMTEPLDAGQLVNSIDTNHLTSNLSKDITDQAASSDSMPNPPPEDLPSDRILSQNRSLPRGRKVSMSQKNSFDIPCTAGAPPNHPTAPAPTSLQFTSTNYKKVLETLMCGEFGSEPVARLHTRKWIDGAITLLGHDAASTQLKSKGNTNWGMIIVGKREVDTTQTSTALLPQEPTASMINVLCVRKKHKREDGEMVHTPNGIPSADVRTATTETNPLGAAPLTVRKRPKLDSRSPDGTTVQTDFTQ